MTLFTHVEILETFSFRFIFLQTLVTYMYLNLDEVNNYFCYPSKYCRIELFLYKF